ncbi:MAG: hypothetical protein NT053_07950 [Cyanobacteria bacterium]|nr:hypothetical protein [Cyanobacteriota bacterium]
MELIIAKPWRTGQDAAAPAAGAAGCPLPITASTPCSGRCWCHREGVLWHEPSRCNLLFDTLKKSEALFSPSTRYRDLALGPALFHWESHPLATARIETPLGHQAGAAPKRMNN